MITVDKMTPEQLDWSWEPHPVAEHQHGQTTRRVYRCAQPDGWWAQLVQLGHPSLIAGPYPDPDTLTANAQHWCTQQHGGP